MKFLFVSTSIRRAVLSRAICNLSYLCCSVSACIRIDWLSRRICSRKFRSCSVYWNLSPFIHRFVILRKRPTRLKLLCAIAVFVGLFVCLIPTIFYSVDPKAKKTTNEADGVSRVMWPIIFMLGFVSVSLTVGKLFTVNRYKSGRQPFVRAFWNVSFRISLRGRWPIYVINNKAVNKIKD